jgi:hypothetical protein
MDINGNRTSELVRKQVKEDGRKTEAARKRTKNRNRTKIRRVNGQGAETRDR